MYVGPLTKRRYPNYLSPEAQQGHPFWTEPISSYEECVPLIRFGIVTILLFLGYWPVYKCQGHCWTFLYWAVIFFSILYLLAKLFLTEVRVYLYDGAVNNPIASAPRRFLLSYFPIIEVIFIFALLYQISFYLFPKGSPPLGSSLGKGGLPDPFRPLHALYFSTVSLTTLGYGDFHPTHDTFRVLVCLETLIGLTLIVFIVALSIAYFPKRKENIHGGYSVSLATQKSHQDYLDRFVKYEKKLDEALAAHKWQTSHQLSVSDEQTQKARFAAKPAVAPQPRRRLPYSRGACCHSGIRSRAGLVDVCDSGADRSSPGCAVL